MQDPVYSKIEGTPRPTLFAANGLIWLAAIGLWVSELAACLLPQTHGALAMVNMAYYLCFVALPIALYMRRRPGLSDAMRLNPPPLGQTLVVILLAVLSVYAASAITAAWDWLLNALGLHGFAGTPLPETQRELLASIITLAAIPAVCEEMLFRGMGIAAWETRGTWYAIGMTSALFALMHGNLYGLPAYLLVGATAGFVTFALNSVYAGIVYHTVYNTFCLVVPWLVASGGDSGAESAVDAAFILSVALETLTMLGMMAILLASLRLLARRSGNEPIPRIRRPLDGREKLTLIGATGTMLATIIIVLAMNAGAAG